MSNQRSQLFNRTKSLPVDLSECGRDYLCRDHSRDDHMLLTNKYMYTRDNHMKRRTNGFHITHKENHTSCGMLKLVEDNKGELSESNLQRGNDSPLSNTEPHDTNGDIMHNDELLDRQCAKVRHFLSFTYKMKTCWTDLRKKRKNTFFLTKYHKSNNHIIFVTLSPSDAREARNTVAW